MSLTEIIAFIGTALPLLIGLLTFLVKAVKNGRAKKVLQQTLEITQALQPIIIKAEEFSHYTGLEKKQFVLTQANQFALDNKLKFNADTVGELIEEIVATTKKVNARSKDVAVSKNEQSPQTSNSVPARETI